ncbi:exosortase system-associated protein, TIGR04073 family [Methylobacter sp. S3L5C]|uniref:exosortase system-associated protein, TIGR04073 family n=1 Tax=Methylobacter sp. S3L5C TaxID=2839024 RepID=UPI001FAC286E|nr:exosortase system-associated protein, TIGR04073 family [Methylobacter sp. S3L5C]UOA09633.1 exosortase system-associated protein, TIGR04073 family [Methylobacter sp. S3L5C]
MIKYNRFYVFLLFISLFMAYMPTAHADMPQQSYGNQAGVNLQQSSYGEKIGNKALNAFANLATSPLEIPKNIINTMNQSNFFYGVFGGFIKGLVNTLGRAGCGIADLITLPIPTRPIAHPVYIWDDFDMDTTYGEVLRLDNTKKTDQPIIETPITQAAPISIPVATPAKTAVVDRSNQYNHQTNKNLDMLFNNKMQK